VGYRVGVVCERGLPPVAGGRERNEDSYLRCVRGVVRYYADEAHHEEQADGDGALLAVFDGLGGHTEGHVASATAARVLAKLYQPGAPANPTRVLTHYIRQAQETLYFRARGPDGRVRMGTTLTAAWLLRGAMHWVHVGDSRLYHCRDGQLAALTEDHTRNAFRVRDGLGVEPGGDHLAQGFIYGSRGLGHDPQLRIDQGRDAGVVLLEPGDRVLLCTDGLSGALSPAQIRDLLLGGDDAQTVAEALVAAALAAGTLDNVTALVVVVDSAPDDDLVDWTDDGEETVQF
jgi:serine/threonine protein phosphatase PrpC